MDVATDPLHGNCATVAGGLNLGTPLNTTLYPTGLIGGSLAYPSGGRIPAGRTQ